jgi:hypothetical protein
MLQSNLSLMPNHTTSFSTIFNPVTPVFLALFLCLLNHDRAEVFVLKVLGLLLYWKRPPHLLFAVMMYFFVVVTKSNHLPCWAFKLTYRPEHSFMLSFFPDYVGEDFSGFSGFKMLLKDCVVADCF